MSQTSKKAIVVGAGISGLSAAIFLARHAPEMEVEVWEAAEHTGGLLAPISFCGVDCDRGSHRVHPQADPLLVQLTETQRWQKRPRRGKLVLQQRQISYPPRLFDFLRGLGLRTALDMGVGFLTRPKALKRYLNWENDRSQVTQSDEGFEQFVVERVGYAAYQQFYRPYVEKVWGLPPSEISRTVAKQRVSTSNPWRILSGALQDKPAGSQGSFLYPSQGMSGLLLQLQQHVENLGIPVHMGRKVDVHSLHKIDASAVFFSGHLSDIAPESKLHHRGLYLIHLAFAEGSIYPADTYYTPEPDYWFGRVSQLEEFSPELKAANKHILCVEIPEGQWGPKHNFLQHIEALKQQLTDAGIVRPEASILDSKQSYIPRVYPLYLRGWHQRWRSALQQIQQQPHVFPIGRQGLFLHCNMDHCVRISKEAVRHFHQTQNSTTWINQLHQFLDLRVRD